MRAMWVREVRAMGQFVRPRTKEEERADAAHKRLTERLAGRPRQEMPLDAFGAPHLREDL